MRRGRNIKMKRYNDYDTFAWLYNKEWGGFADNIFPSLQSIAGEKLFNGAKILDLCCGTGQLAKELTAKAYEVTGIDGSAEMLRYAKENAPSARFILKDARAFKLPQIRYRVLNFRRTQSHHDPGGTGTGI